MEPNEKLCIKIEDVWRDYRSARISTKELIEKLDELKAIVNALESLNPTPKNCNICHTPVYKHHMCEDYM